jgi:hypothetical protein
VAEVVYFGNQTGAYLQLDGDSFPVCSIASALPEVISGAFTLGTTDGCGGGSCGCELQFRFWRNLFSTCNGGSNSDITTQTVEVECTSGSVTVRTSGGDVPLNASDAHVFNTIDFDSSQGAVPSSGSGECFSVAAASATAAFTVTAALDWSNATDHDLYGEVSCGGCA